MKLSTFSYILVILVSPLWTPFSYPLTIFLSIPHWFGTALFIIFPLSKLLIKISKVQSCNPPRIYGLLLLLFSHQVMSDSLQPQRLKYCRFPCLSPSPSLFKFMSIEPVMPSKHLILCHCLLLLPSIFPSIRVWPTCSLRYGLYTIRNWDLIFYFPQGQPVQCC